MNDKQFTVRLRRTYYAEVVVTAATAQQAREKVEADGAHETMVGADSFHDDTTTVVAVKRCSAPSTN